ncbi:hypothetical protein [Stappia sediminis]|uniref:hypothetical protein n=1 Tax=Stappia sediminis TaxID=2692190 RepID=UPI001AD8EDEC|nr:hypothetical protein [Stappia sediminis]
MKNIETIEYLHAGAKIGHVHHRHHCGNHGAKIHPADKCRRPYGNKNEESHTANLRFRPPLRGGRNDPFNFLNLATGHRNSHESPINLFAFRHNWHNLQETAP